MSTNYLLIGLYIEGTTDVRFLESVVRRTYEDIAFDGRGDIDIDVCVLKIDKKGLGFVDQIQKVAIHGLHSSGIRILCIHTDADASSDLQAFARKIDPALKALRQLEESEACRVCSFIVPVYMTESWMLGDKELLKKQIGTDLSDAELGITDRPEEIQRPKTIIEEAIRIARQGTRQRLRNKLSISDLYLPVGQQIEIEKLENIPSFVKFKLSAIESLRNLGLYD